MLLFAAFLSYVALAFTAINSIQIRTPKKAEKFPYKVSVLLPMRNEEKNVDELLLSLSQQTGIDSIEFLILDDHSTDSTKALAEKWVKRDPRFSVASGSDLPAGWIGKTWALQQLLLQSSGEIIISIDSDVRLGPSALASSIAAMGDLTFFSPYPAQITQSFAERMIQPLLQWSWLSSVPLKFAERSGNPAFAVANGQFFIVRRSALAKIDEYKSIKGEVLDDIELARSLIRSGARGTAGNGAHIASCHMYSSWAEIKNGYGKSLWKAFGGPIGRFTAIALIFLTGILPFAYAITGSLFGLLGYGAIVLSRIFAALKTGGRILDCFLHPLSSALLIYLILYSTKKHQLIQWKGRTL